jgi:hypothetical protein
MPVTFLQSRDLALRAGGTLTCALASDDTPTAALCRLPHAVVRKNALHHRGAGPCRRA